MNRKITLLLILLLFPVTAVFAQLTTVKGTVVDARTKQPVSFASVYFPQTNAAVVTDDDGKYLIQFNGTANQMKVSLAGYNTATFKITPGIEQVLNIKLTQDSKQLHEVVIKAKKGKYRNKDNPAVALIREVIAHKAENKMKQYDYVSYQEYEKIQFSLSNTPEKLRRNILVRKYPFIAQNLDTTTLEDKALLPLYMQENLSDNYFRSRPQQHKQIITAEKKITFDESFIDNNGMTTYLKHVYQDIDIYQNDIMVMTNQFLSPIADLSPNFYKFYIIDTLRENGDTLVQLTFGPRNKADFLFQGSMYITLDGNYAVQKVDMRVNKHANLNWVKNMSISLAFERNTDRRYYLSKSKLTADFGLSKNSDGGIFGERTVSFRHFNSTQVLADSLFKGDPVVHLKSAAKKSDTFWKENRHDSLTYAEEVVYNNIDSLQHTRSFKRALNIGMLLLAGYIKASPYVEVGPFNTFYSFNPVEGFRGRVGGRTTPELSKRIYFETYAAYGFKDEQWKYYLGGIYSFTNRSIYEFPVRKLSANFQHDMKIPGQELQFVQEDNIFLSFKRGVNDKWLYNDIYKIDYLNEFRNHLSFDIGYKNWRQQAAGGLTYESTSTAQAIKDLTTSEFSLELRWAPHEEFYQGKLYRIPLPNRYPVFTLRGIAGVDGFMGSQYTYQNISANIYKRVYLSQLGYADVVLEGGYVFGTVPYPLLDIHRANQSYSYQLQSYNLMNFLEFVSDHYASIQIDQCFNGFFFNKIPLLKKLKFREFVSFKALYGGLRAENTPGKTNNDLIRLPTDDQGNPTTFTLGKEPYIEGSVGVGNILKFFRVDVVRRFTYLDNPHVSATGIRARFKFDF